MKKRQLIPILAVAVGLWVAGRFITVSKNKPSDTKYASAENKAPQEGTVFLSPDLATFIEKLSPPNPNPAITCEYPFWSDEMIPKSAYSPPPKKPDFSDTLSSPIKPQFTVDENHNGRLIERCPPGFPKHAKASDNRPFDLEFDKDGTNP